VQHEFFNGVQGLIDTDEPELAQVCMAIIGGCNQSWNGSRLVGVCTRVWLWMLVVINKSALSLALCVIDTGCINVQFNGDVVWGCRCWHLSII
jgi:hypothetical protein